MLCLPTAGIYADGNFSVGYDTDDLNYHVRANV